MENSHYIDYTPSRRRYLLWQSTSNLIPPCFFYRIVTILIQSFTLYYRFLFWYFSFLLVGIVERQEKDLGSTILPDSFFFLMETPIILSFHFFPCYQERDEFGMEREGKVFSEGIFFEITQYTLNVTKYLLEYAKTHLNTFFCIKTTLFYPNPYLFCLKALVFP